MNQTGWIGRPLAAALLVAFAVSGCADRADVDAIRAKPNAGGPFHKALQGDYADLSAFERREADWRDAVFFAGRAERAADGEPFPPQDLGERRIPDHAQSELGAARARLMTVLTDEVRGALPAQSSLAQTGFDCWMEQQEEDFQPEDIAACKRTFDGAIIGLERAPAPRSAPAAAPAMRPSTARQFRILFDTNSAALTPAARGIVADIVAAFLAAGPKAVLIVGHTDTVGNQDANILLSQRRTETVAAALVAGGVPQDRMRLEAYGEERPAVAMGDNAAEQINRRVDVTLEQ